MTDGGASRGDSQRGGEGLSGLSVIALLDIVRNPSTEAPHGSTGEAVIRSR